MQIHEISYQMSGSTAPDPCKLTTYSLDDVQPHVLPPELIDNLSKAPLVVGDRVTALPYWSEVERQQAVGDGVLEFEYHYSNEAANWSVPPVGCAPTLQGSGRIFGTLDVWRYAPRIPGNVLPLGTPSEWESLQRLADTKALANLNKALISIPLLIKERKETAEMIASKVGAISRAAQAAYKRDFSKYKKAVGRLNKREVARNAANSHLEMIFGFLPLISEVEGLAELLAMPDLDFIRCRGTQTMILESTEIASKTTVKTPSSISALNTQRNLVDVSYKGTVTKSISVRTALRYKLDVQLSGDARLLGFEPIGAAFDMIPLSFVTGWISNLDHYIKGLAPLIGVTFETGSRNRRQRTIGLVDGSVAPFLPGPIWGQTPKWIKLPEGVNLCTLHTERMRNTRSVLAGPPEASLHWDVDVGLYEVAAGLSLAVQRYVKPLKRIAKSNTFRYKGRRPKWLANIRYRKP